MHCFHDEYENSMEDNRYQEEYCHQKFSYNLPKQHHILAFLENMDFEKDVSNPAGSQRTGTTF
jgi:hypothetical protein